MKTPISRSFIFVILLTLAFGTLSAVTAQTKKPVLKRKPVARKPAVVKAPAVPVYSVNTGSVIRVRMNQTVSSKTAKVGDTFNVTVTEPVYSENGVVVVPVGSTITAKIDAVKAAEKAGKPGEIDASFTQLRLPNGTRRTINGSLTELVADSAKSDNEGTASGDKMKHRKVIFYGGGAGGGAILGAAIGGGKGAAIGGLIGAGVGVLGERLLKGEEAQIKSGTEFSIHVNQRFTLPRFVERDGDVMP